MGLSEKDKRLLIILGIIGAIAVLYFFIYKPFNMSMEILYGDIGKLQQQYDNLLKKESNREKAEAEMKFINDKTREFDDMLPPDLPQERLILIMEDLQAATGMGLENITFSQIAPITDSASGEDTVGTGSEDMNKSLQTAQANLQKILDQAGGTGAENTEKEKVSIPDNTGIKVEVGAAYTATYEQLKSLLAKILSYQSRIVVKNITIASAQDGELSGNITVVFYGYKDSTRELPEWEYGTAKGKDNPFTAFEGFVAGQSGQEEGISGSGRAGTEKDGDKGTAKKEDVQYDFIMSVFPFSADSPTVTLGKSKDRMGDTYVYADNNGVEDVEFRLLKKDGKYYYKYRTAYSVYPGSYQSDWVEFKPGAEEIELLVYSTSRKDASDMSGVNLSVYNETDTALNIKVIDDDREEPRVNVIGKSGTVNTAN